ncbi:MAG: hypothetical protein QXM68_03555 [Candidatus Aenigmatarchaeota archaeon]|nr:hypothetical protein [Candidatus Aenigmarchaeota archaeon]
MKGISGYIIAFVITIILASLGIVLIWVFLKNTASNATIFSKETVDSICRSLGVISSLLGC